MENAEAASEWRLDATSFDAGIVEAASRGACNAGIVKAASRGACEGGAGIVEAASWGACEGGAGLPLLGVVVKPLCGKNRGCD